MRNLDELRYDNRYAALGEPFATPVQPTAVPAPHLVHFNAEAARAIGLDSDARGDPDFVATVAGNRVAPGMAPVAMRYAGHQFGMWVPQLGDGRAIVLGEATGIDGTNWQLQLKGAGPTPYSRGFDGRAVLRSTIREYLCSEAMHGLGVPTTRALSIAGSDQPVYREEVESAAIMLRMSPSLVRFGSFELFAARERHDDVRRLADHVIDHHYPEVRSAESPYAAFFEAVTGRTARLVAAWQSVGFAHGVLNTDNMSILGETIDYGPFGFVEAYDPEFVCNHSDDTGRYAFGRQPSIGLWNLVRLAEALAPLAPMEELRDSLERYETTYVTAHVDRMWARLGLAEAAGGDDVRLIQDLLGLLARDRVDYHLFFRRLTAYQPGGSNTDVVAMFRHQDDIRAWLRRYDERAAGTEPEWRRARMERHNPRYVLRNHLAQRAIERAQSGDYGEVDRLLRVLQDPFREHPGCKDLAQPAPADAPPVVVSCSS